MKLFQEFLSTPSGRAILLSIKPIYSDLILLGKKRIEFRRTWAADDVGVIAIYASAPTQRIVALVDIKEVVMASPAKLWGYCQSHGGGVSKIELSDYLADRKLGYGVFLGQVHKLKMPVELKTVSANIHPPQSFRYLTMAEVKKLAKFLPEAKGRG